MNFLMTFQTQNPAWNANTGAHPNHNSGRSKLEVERLTKVGLNKFMDVILKATDYVGATNLQSAWKKLARDGRSPSVTVSKGIHQIGDDAHITVHFNERADLRGKIHVNLTLLSDGSSSYWCAVGVGFWDGANAYTYPRMSKASRAHSAIGRRDSVDYEDAKLAKAAAEANEIARLGAIDISS
ncbi:MAG: hypothetical protein V4754_20595 [Pseudomonadota bacterium]